MCEQILNRLLACIRAAYNQPTTVDSGIQYAAVFTLDLQGGTRLWHDWRWHGAAGLDQSRNGRPGMDPRPGRSHGLGDPAGRHPRQSRSVAPARRQAPPVSRRMAGSDGRIDRWATHILCLVSTRYRELWSRKRDVEGGFGVAFESIRLIHHLYWLKQHNDGRILTLRPVTSGYDCIPRDLALDCPAYRWGGDRDILLSHVGEAALSASAASQVRTSEVTPAPAPPVALPSATRALAQVTQTSWSGRADAPRRRCRS